MIVYFFVHNTIIQMISISEWLEMPFTRTQGQVQLSLPYTAVRIIRYCDFVHSLSLSCRIQSPLFNFDSDAEVQQLHRCIHLVNSTTCFILRLSNTPQQVATAPNTDLYPHITRNASHSRWNLSLPGPLRSHKLK